jgi:4-amino-4-deoxy-L-arabinose transferase-like glycosyltransferase
MTTFEGRAVREFVAPIPLWRGWGLPLSYRQAAALLVGIILVTRVAILFTADYNRNPDEAQYWSWSKDLAFGYFSKPPMIAWLIALTTALFGDSEAAIRLAAPLLHAATAFAIFALAQSLYDERVAFWSCLVYFTVPAVWFSSGLITTDVPLLLFWCLALLALHRTLETRSMRWATALGVAVGLGMMSKYAMLYFAICGGLYLGVCRRDRWLLWSRQGLLAVVIAILLSLPNILWNLDNHLATVGHTTANAGWNAGLFNADEFLEFLTAQLGVFGPLLFCALIWGLITLRHRLQGRADVYLVCFVAPVLAIVMLQAFISHANANWAATAYVAAAILVVVWLLRHRRLAWAVPASVAIHTALGMILYALVLSPSLADGLGRDNDFKQVRGWDVMGAAVAEMASKGYHGKAYSAVLTDDRFVHTSLLYYGRPHQQPVVMWNGDGLAQNHYELTTPYKPSLGTPLLFTTERSETEADPILSRFREHRLLETLEIPIGGEKTRVIRLFALHGLRDGAHE